MRLALKKAPPLQPTVAEHTDYTEHAEGGPSLMTPARRAALDALEREFHELVVQGILKTAGR